ncbi:MAG: phosphoheptose isomerase family protein [Candidatus Latescibacterota bacterium]
MNRRNALQLLSLLGAGLAAIPEAGYARGKRPRELGLIYLDGIRAGIRKIRETESENLLRAAAAIAKVRKSGGNCFCQWETGHSFDGDLFPGRHGDTDLFMLGYTMAKPAVAPKSGDLLLVNVIRQPLDDPRGKGLFVIGGPNPWGADTVQRDQLTEANKALTIRAHSDIWIEFHYTPYGALVPLPKEEIPLGPTTAAYGMVTYWAMVADAARLLARDGSPIAVKGDEPRLVDNANRVSPEKPLGGQYFEESLRQIGRIEEEMGVIRRVTRAIADTISAKGKLYVYSGHREALAGEANQKRGGLALINTTSPEDAKFAGTAQDFMIMGIYQPDDATDLKMLDKFRGLGMKIASIGPVTRDGKTPPGRSIPNEADFHLGWMMDTYGLFALPGVDRKICPTSGLLVNVMFWTTMVQLAEEIMRYTGNAPAVLSTGAVVGGAEQRKRAAELVKARGY